MSIRIAVALTALFSSLFLLALFCVLSCGGSAGGTLASGRSVTTYSDAWDGLSSTFTADTARIDTAGRTILIRPEQILIDGRPLTKIDKATKSVAVRVEGDTINFAANGRIVATCPR